MAKKRELEKSPFVLIGVPIIVAVIGVVGTLLAVFLPKWSERAVPVAGTTAETTSALTELTPELPNASNEGIIVHDNWIYCAVNGGIYCTRLDASEIQLLAKTNSDKTSPNMLFLIDDWIYTDRVKVKLDGSEVLELGTTGDLKGMINSWLIYDEGYNHFSEEDVPPFRMKTDGSSRSSLFESDKSHRYFISHVEDDWIYYLDWDDEYEDRFHRMKIDGTQKEKVKEDTDYDPKLLTDNAKFVWKYVESEDEGKNKYVLQKSNLNGTSSKEIFTFEVNVTNADVGFICEHNGYLYYKFGDWYEPKEIRRIKMDGTGDMLFTNTKSRAVYGWLIVDDWIIWTEGGRVDAYCAYASRTDGTDKRTLLEY